MLHFWRVSAVISLPVTSPQRPVDRSVWRERDLRRWSMKKKCPLARHAYPLFQNDPEKCTRSDIRVYFFRNFWKYTPKTLCIAAYQLLLRPSGVKITGFQKIYTAFYQIGCIFFLIDWKLHPNTLREAKYYVLRADRVYIFLDLLNSTPERMQWSKKRPGKGGSGV